MGLLEPQSSSTSPNSMCRETRRRVSFTRAIAARQSSFGFRLICATVLLAGSCTHAFQISALAPFSLSPKYSPLGKLPLRHGVSTSVDESSVCNSLLSSSFSTQRIEKHGMTGAMAKEGSSEFDKEIAEDLAIQVMRKKLHDKWFQGRLKAKSIHLPFKEAVKWARAMGRWDSEEEWWEWIEMGEGKNPYIPSNPEKYYGERGQWRGWDYWLGVNKYAPKKGGDADGEGK